MVRITKIRGTDNYVVSGGARGSLPVMVQGKGRARMIAAARRRVIKHRAEKRKALRRPPTWAKLVEKTVRRRG